MKAQLRYLSGARTGQVDLFSKAYIALGRHPLSDARFDADRDLEVSSQHAAILRQGDRFILRDLGSRNGTFLNGAPVTEDVPLADGAVIGFGRKGPSVEFHVVEAEAPSSEHVSDGVRASAHQVAAPREQIRAVSAPVTSAGRPANASTSVRIAAEVSRQTRHLRWTTKILLGLLLASAAGLGWIEWNDQRNAHEIAALQARADSLNRAAQQLLARFQSELQSVRQALQESQAEAARLRNELETAGTGDPAAVARLRSQLDSVEARQRGLTDAASVDYRAISERNAYAVALVVVKFSDVEVFTGTAFAIDSQGTLVTNKHVLAGEDGTRRPLGIAVKFAGSEQWFQGQVLGVADSADIGVLRVPVRGGTPRVVGLAPNGLRRGDPVAILGYPLGEDLPMEHQGAAAVADPTLTVGTVSKVLHDLIQVDGYGAPGSSGSPIFNRDGLVVGVLYGGPRESHGKIVYAVPTSVVQALLARLRTTS